MRTSRRLLLVANLLALALAAALPAGWSLLQCQVAQASPTQYLGLVSMGMPTAPQPWMPSDFALTKHFRQSSGTVNNGYGPPADSGNEAMTADHGADCGPPPATHAVGTGYSDVVFVCHDHVMTAINSAAYAELLFQPNQLVDFSNGPATVSISVSTLARSSRDWIDWLFVPFSEQLAVNTDDNVPENIKLPRDFVQVREQGTGFTFQKANEAVQGVETALATNWWEDLNSFTPASATVRTPITFTLSTTHLTVSAAGHTFVDDTFPTPLPFTQAVFQTMHHSYNPTKEGAGTPNTWHWSNLSISSAVPYALRMAMPEAVGDYSWLGQRITFPAAPDGAYLRGQWFDAQHGATPSGQISFDGGATWQAVAAQRLAPITGIVSDVVMVNTWQAVPKGATSALLRGAGGWYARDLYLMAASTNGEPPAPPAAGTEHTSSTPAANLPTATALATAAPPTPLKASGATPVGDVPCTTRFTNATR